MNDPLTGTPCPQVAMDEKRPIKSLEDLLPTPFAADYGSPLDLYTEREMFRYAERIIDQCLNIIATEQQATGETWQGKDGINIWYKIAGLKPTKSHD